MQEECNKKPRSYWHGRALYVSTGKSISFENIFVSPSNQQTTKTGTKRRLIPAVDNSDYNSENQEETLSSDDLTLDVCEEEESEKE